MKYILNTLLFFALILALIIIYYSESIVDIAFFKWSVEMPIAAIICFTLSMGISVGILLSKAK